MVGLKNLEILLGLQHKRTILLTLARVALES